MLLTQTPQNLLCVVMSTWMRINCQQFMKVFGSWTSKGTFTSKEVFQEPETLGTFTPKEPFVVHEPKLLNHFYLLFLVGSLLSLFHHACWKTETFQCFHYQNSDAWLETKRLLRRLSGHPKRSGLGKRELGPLFHPQSSGSSVRGIKVLCSKPACISTKLLCTIAGVE